MQLTTHYHHYYSGCLVINCKPSIYWIAGPVRCSFQLFSLHRQSLAPSVLGSLNEKDDKSKKAKQPIIIWPEWSEQDIGQEKWVSHKYFTTFYIQLT